MSVNDFSRDEYLDQKIEIEENLSVIYKNI